MNKIDCPNFDDCSAPLCPVDDGSIRNGIWYPDEEICRKRSVIGWVRKQKAIVKKKPPLDRFFTVAMVEALRQVRKGIEGLNPDQHLEQAKETERKWVEEKKGGRVIANENHKLGRVIAEKRKSLVGVTSTSNQLKGGEN